MRLVLALLLFAGCCAQKELSVRREWVTHGRLASVFARTPDPLKRESYFGQRLVIQWRIPPALFTHEETLRLQLLFGNWQRETLIFPLTIAKGYLTYSLMSCDFEENRGLLSYKAELLSNEEVIESWAHPTWVEWIEPHD